MMGNLVIDDAKQFFDQSDYFHHDIGALSRKLLTIMSPRSLES